MTFQNYKNTFNNLVGVVTVCCCSHFFTQNRNANLAHLKEITIEKQNANVAHA